MPYYKDLQNRVHFLDSDGFSSLLPVGCVEITKQEADGLLNPPISLAEIKTSKIISIDAEVDSIYAAAIGNRAPEYMDAEASANAFKNAGYTGTVPSEVQSWADAKNWTATQAADDILAAAAQLNGAKQAIRAQRLLHKEQVRNAADQAAIDTAMTAWAAFVVQIRTQLGL